MKNNSISVLDWEQVRLDDISFDFISGGTPSTSKLPYWDGDIHWMRSAHISGKEVYTGEKFITKTGLDNSATNVVPKDNLLVATRVSLGNVVINRVDMAISQDLTGILLNKEKINEDFLYYLIKTKENDILSLAQGTTIKGILRDDLKKLRIFLPPLIEQRGIVEVLGTVDECIRLTDAVIERAEELKRGLMQRLLTRGIGHTEYKETPFGNIPEKWEILPLGKLSNLFISGGTPSTDVNEYWGGDIPWMRSAHITGKEIFVGEKFVTTKGINKSASNVVPKNNLLIATRVSLGKIAINRIDMAISQDLTGVVLNNEFINVDFLYWYLIHSKNKILSLQQGTTIKGILKTDLKKIKCLIPLKKEQIQISNILNNIEDSINTNINNKNIFLTLKHGLMQELLSGNIRVELKGDGLHRIRYSREAHH